MSRTKQVTQLTEQIIKVAPELQFVAAYNADDPQLQASMRMYEKRCFVYVLMLQLERREACIYVGKTQFQYARLLQHKTKFAFDRIYLYECEKEALKRCEASVIRLLKPLFNQLHNPMCVRYNRVLDLDPEDSNDKEKIKNYFDLWDQYCKSGLYGFALPPEIYSVLEREAETHDNTISEELTFILEAFFSEEIADELKKQKEIKRTNLITTIEYGELYGKSQEQIKQYLQQEGRLSGQKIGRDWVVIDSDKFPEDKRKRSTNL